MDSDKKSIVFNESHIKELKEMEMKNQYSRLVKLLMDQEAAKNLMKNLANK